MKNAQQILYLTGEAPIVQEFGLECHRAGFIVVVKTGASQSLPREFIRSKAIPKRVALAFELTNIDRSAKFANLRSLDRALPRSVPVLSSSVTVTVAEQSRLVRQPGRLVGVGGFPTLMRRPLLEFSVGPATGREVLTKVTDFVIRLGKQFVIVQDRIGMVMPRILAMVMNEAAFALTEGLATASDIDTAMKLGTNYPAGPVEWLGRAGADQTAAVLEALHADLGDDRYRLAPLLRQLQRTVP